MAQQPASQVDDLLKYPRPSVAVDVVLFTVVERSLRVLLIQRDNAPELGAWALPGGFIHPEDANAEAAAHRILKAKAGADKIFLEQLRSYTNQGRDPRSWVISLAYYALVDAERLDIQPGQGAQDARWFGIKEDKRNGHLEPVALTGNTKPQVAFDHAHMVSDAVARIRGKLDYADIGFQLLPDRFTLTELQHVHEAILNAPIDKRNFRTKLLKNGVVKPTKDVRTGNHRPAQLFKYVEHARD